MTYFKTPKTRSKQTRISPFIPDASSVASVPPGLGTASPEVSAVTGSHLAMGAPHSPRPTLTGTVDANTDAMLRHIPIVFTTASVVIASPRSHPVVNIAAPGGGDASGTRHSALPDRCLTLYKSSLPIQGKEYLHSNPTNDTVNRDVKVSKPMIDILGYQNSTTLLL